MKRIILKAYLPSIFFISCLATAQLGINAIILDATLDIILSPSDLEKLDSFILPKLTGEELKTKDDL